MSIYFIVLALCILLTFTAQKLDFAHDNVLSFKRVYHSRSTKIFFALTAAVLIFVSGFRYGVGADYWAYYRNGAFYSSTLLDSVKQLSEPGLKLLYLIVRCFTKESIVPLFFFALLTISLMLVTLYRSTDKLLLAMLLFLFLGCWHDSFNAVRQCLAAAIVFCGLRFIKEKKFVQYLLVVFVAFLFHRTAIIMIMAYFIFNMKYSLRNIILVVLATAIVLFAYDRLFDFTEWVLQDDLGKDRPYLMRQVHPLRIAVAVIPALYFMVMLKGRERGREQQFYLYVLIMHAALMVMASQSAMMARVGIYTAPFCAIAIPELNKLQSPRNQKVFTGLVFVLFVVFWIHDISIDNTLNPFVWYWSRGSQW